MRGCDTACPAPLSVFYNFGVRNMKQNENDKQYTGGIAVKGGFAAWFSNFWYHYKWVVIGVVVALVIVLVCTLQMCSKKKEDVVIVYAGPNYLSQTELANVAELFSKIMPRDFDGNGEKLAEMSTYQIYSAEQIARITEETDADGVHGYVDRNRNTSEYDTYYNYLLTGESSVCLLDPWLYEKLREADRLQPLSAVLADATEGGEEQYGVRLGDTELYRQYAVLGVLPEDTVICLLKPYVVGKSSKAELYRYEIEMFAALVGKEAIPEK